MIKLYIISFVILAASACHDSNGVGQPAIQKVNKVAFVLYNNFDTALLNTAISEATSFYHCTAIVLPPKDLPAFAYYHPRQRYKADSLLKFQSGLLPKGCETVVGLTQKDISTSMPGKPDWGIFGLGYQPGNACVVSVFRLTATTYEQYRERFVKVLLHELGHNQGLPHCTYNQYCLMNDAHGTIAQVDKERKWLCENCRKILSR